MNPRLRSAAFVVLVFVAAVAGVLAGLRFRESRAPAPPVPESELVPGREFPDAVLAAPDGVSRRTGDLLAGRGGAVLFLKLDCGPCGRAVAAWQEAIDAGELDGVPVWGVTIDPPEAIVAYRAERGLDFPVYHDPERVSVGAWGVRSVPLVVVVDRAGEIVATRSDPRQPVDGAELRELIAGG